MVKYLNKSGKSGVEYYEAGEDYIKVWFHTGTPYLYNYHRPGKIHVDRMKKLAAAGLGLSTYISRFIGENYDRE